MPVGPLTLGLRIKVRVGDLEASDYMTVHCPQCRHVHRVSPWQLHERFDAATLIVDLEKRMTCKGCNHRGSLTWQLWRAQPAVRPVIKGPLRKLLPQASEAERE